MKNLKRYPFKKNDQLQAWDASDELVLEHINGLKLADEKILVINDSFGAISHGLKKRDLDITMYTDSYISYKATLLNTNNEVNVFHDLEKLKGDFDLIIIKLPKNLSFFEDLLCKISSMMKPSSKVIYSSMIKHLSKGVFPLIQNYIGETSTSLAKKKARLIFSNFEKGESLSKFPFCTEIEGFSKDFLYHSNLFSRGKLDVGTRFFLQHIPKGNFENILDLGCANGIVGIKAKLINSDSSLSFCDESYMAIKSAADNYLKHTGEYALYHWTNCYEIDDYRRFDLVLCNPPFHQNNTVGDFIAIQMFKDAKRVLKKGGVLVVIGNSHLAYPSKLKRIFNNNAIIAKNKKFIICSSIKH